jgi:hypothetical protein
LEKVLKLRGVSFTWNVLNDEVSKIGKRDIGFIAQEIGHILPELVFKKNTENAYFMVKYAEVIAVCLEAIKEQSTILETRERKLDELETIAKERGLI